MAGWPSPPRATSTLKVWDVASGRELRTLAGHTGEVSAVALTPDGRLAVSASWDDTLKVWDVASGRELRTLAGHTGSVRAVALTPDGRLAVSASGDHTLKVWDVASGRELRTLAGHTEPGQRRGAHAGWPAGRLRLRRRHAQGVGRGERAGAAHPGRPYR